MVRKVCSYAGISVMTESLLRGSGLCAAEATQHLRIGLNGCPFHSVRTPRTSHLCTHLECFTAVLRVV